MWQTCNSQGKSLNELTSNRYRLTVGPGLQKLGRRTEYGNRIKLGTTANFNYLSANLPSLAAKYFEELKFRDSPAKPVFLTQHAREPRY